jgi:hypothetical protein
LARVRNSLTARSIRAWSSKVRRSDYRDGAFQLVCGDAVDIAGLLAIALVPEAGVVAIARVTTVEALRVPGQRPKRTSSPMRQCSISHPPDQARCAQHVPVPLASERGLVNRDPDRKSASARCLRVTQGTTWLGGTEHRVSPRWAQQMGQTEPLASPRGPWRWEERGPSAAPNGAPPPSLRGQSHLGRAKPAGGNLG